MTHDPQQLSPIFRIDVSSESTGDPPTPVSGDDDVKQLLRRMVKSQEQQTQLLRDLVSQLGAAQRQRASELGQWKAANPELATRCRTAAEALSRVQTEFLENLTEDVDDNFDSLIDGEFMLNEFVDRYGPRLAHLNGVLQVLSQLSSVPNPANPGQ